MRAGKRLRTFGNSCVGLCGSLVALLCATAFVSVAAAADVDMRLSSREAFVGGTITLDLRIINAEQYEPPELPEIDGLEIEAAGAPMTSSRVTIVNGRRSEQTSTTLRYRITPQRAGNFVIPPLRFEVDGTKVSTSPLRFSATRSETGDLLFVEVVGQQSQVYVGEPLELTLKIWLRPYRDPERKLTISEADMWNMIAESTDWGIFSERMRELQQNRQRPGGRSVTRPDENGVEREYYLYQITATVYPKKPGRIDGDAIRVVVNYPTRLAVVRGGFDDFFRGGAFPFDDDDFPSPFRDQLRVAEARPIIASAEVDQTNVLPVPDQGRPANYRGAVGRYTIAANASPTELRAGDSIRLNLTIAGEGPLELVQAPPLDQQPELTRDFRVSSAPLAGLVREDEKYFSTTIRPLRPGIKEIPPIEFSYFDPQTEQFETVRTEPIPITVREAETLQLDDIAAAESARPATESRAEDGAGAGEDRDRFANHPPAEALRAGEPWRVPRLWWAAMLTPPLLVVMTAALRLIMVLAGWSVRLRSARRRCSAELRRAESASQLRTALAEYLDRVYGDGADTSPNAESAPRGAARQLSSAELFSRGLGQLRMVGAPAVAAELESWGHRVERMEVDDDPAPLERLRTEAAQLLQRLDGLPRRRVATRTGSSKRRFWRVAADGAGALLVALSLVVGGGSALADEQDGAAVTEADLQAVLREANALYRQARQQRTAARDGSAAEGNAGQRDPKTPAWRGQFEAAAAKYRWVLQQGAASAALYHNLANAELQAGQPARAVAHYRWALHLDPGHPNAAANLWAAETALADSVVQGTPSGPAGWLSAARSAGDRLWYRLGPMPVMATAATASILFWALVLIRVGGLRYHATRWAIVPGIVWLLSGLVALCGVWPTSDEPRAIVVAEPVALRSGADAQFPVEDTGQLTPGQQLVVLAERGGWRRVRSSAGHIGWLPATSIEYLPPQ